MRPRPRGVVKPGWRKYIGPAVIFAGSCALTILIVLIVQTGVWAGVATLPGVGALFWALFQLMRDDAEHQRQRALQHAQQQFDLGVTSHMADVAFDKHVQFCEAYAKELHATLNTLFREGETAGALAHATRLRDIQNEYIIWVTPQISEKLEPLEAELRRIGAKKHVHNVTNTPMTPKEFEEISDAFYRILDVRVDPGSKRDERVAITAILERLREILAVGELLALRSALVALRHVPKS
jgi:hypothetical protein